MIKVKRNIGSLILGLLLSSATIAWAVAEELPSPKTYIPSVEEVQKHKAFFDDPRPYVDNFGPKQLLPPDLYSKLTYNEEKMKKEWSEVVGFKAPDVVGNIAPEIKPGKYSYKDLAKYPGLKELMIPTIYEWIKPGGPPHAGSIPEFEIIPTRQYYWALPIAEATKQNEGKTKLDSDGYLIADSYKAGYPFPKPSGPFKGQQIMYNVDKRYSNFGSNYYVVSDMLGFDKNLHLDYDGTWDFGEMRLEGRVLMPPLGWYDERAEKLKEDKCYLLKQYTPRDVAGSILTSVSYSDINKFNMMMYYISSMRRVRKMTASDTQDAVAGQDIIFDDHEGWSQKISPARYPYKFEVIGEREYLVFASTSDGAQYITSDNAEVRNQKMERRPIYVVKLTQLDSNYVYSKRILYIDKETFVLYHIENFDQKGRLYRSWSRGYAFFPEMGALAWTGQVQWLLDHIDLHSSMSQSYLLPAFWKRAELGLEESINRK
jgi:hypothetical protein